MKFSFKKLALISIALISLLACDDSDDQTKDVVVAKGTVSLSFDNVVGNDDLILTTKDKDDNVITAKTYTNASGETYEVEELKYIISNIALIKDDGGKFNYPKEESYFVIDEADKSSLIVNLENVPVGEYNAIEYGFGVEPEKYPIESGSKNFVPKAEEKGMLWAWKAGFKFLKFEGTFMDKTANESKDFVYHIGSLGDQQNNYKMVEISLSEPIKVLESENASINLKSDVSKIFNATNVISIEAKPDIQVDKENSPKLAANASAMFSLK